MLSNLLGYFFESTDFQIIYYYLTYLLQCSQFFLLLSGFHFGLLSEHINATWDALFFTSCMCRVAGEEFLLGIADESKTAFPKLFVKNCRRTHPVRFPDALLYYSPLK